MACGLVGSFIFKKMRFLTVSAIKEVLLTFCFGYLAYGFGEMAHMSGIICLLTAGIVFAHYGWFNLSPQGKHLSSASFQVIGFAFEAFVRLRWRSKFLCGPVDVGRHLDEHFPSNM